MKSLLTKAFFGLLFALLYCWIFMQMNAETARESPDPTETKEEKARIEQRIDYHGLNGVVVLYLGRDGKYRFERNGQWCKL